LNSEYLRDCLGETWMTDKLSASDGFDCCVVVMNIC